VKAKTNGLKLTIHFAEVKSIHLIVWISNLDLS
jgi:hypothetical protein